MSDDLRAIADEVHGAVCAGGQRHHKTLRSLGSICLTYERIHAALVRVADDRYRAGAKDAVKKMYGPCLREPEGHGTVAGAVL